MEEISSKELEKTTIDSEQASQNRSLLLNEDTLPMPAVELAEHIQPEFTKSKLNKFKIPKLTKPSIKNAATEKNVIAKNTNIGALESVRLILIFLKDLLFKIFYSSRQLKMTDIEVYNIPEAIRQLESHDIIPPIYYDLLNDPENMEEYISKYTAMLYMEEAAGCKKLQSFDLTNVKLVLHSRQEQTFRILAPVSGCKNYLLLKMKLSYFKVKNTCRFSSLFFFIFYKNF